MVLVGIVGTIGTLIAFVFSTFIQAMSFGLVSGVVAYSLILSYLEREDHSTWKSANHWHENEPAAPSDNAFDLQSSQQQTDMGQAQ